MAAAGCQGDRLDREQQPPEVVPQQLSGRLFHVGHDGPDPGKRAAVAPDDERPGRRGGGEEARPERGSQVGGRDVLVEISNITFFCHTHIVTYVLEEEETPRGAQERKKLSTRFGPPIGSLQLQRSNSGNERTLTELLTVDCVNNFLLGWAILSFVVYSAWEAPPQYANQKANSRVHCITLDLFELNISFCS